MILAIQILARMLLHVRFYPSTLITAPAQWDGLGPTAKKVFAVNDYLLLM